MTKNEKNGIVYFTFDNLEATGLVRHGISSRIGGVSAGHFAAMNLGLQTGDDINNVKENYRLFCEALSCRPENIVMTDQHHTTNIHNVVDKRPFSHIDGLVTDMAGAVLVTYYADCVPLLLCDPVKRVVANCHAGWRGTAHNMAGKTVGKMVDDYDCNPRDILAGIGPSISQKNFEVGAEVVEEFIRLLPFCTEFIHNNHIDLWGVNRQNFIAAGIPDGNIETVGLCTFDDEVHFFSHRRSGVRRGSLAAFIELRPE